MSDWTEELTDEQKSNIMDLVVTTVKGVGRSGNVTIFTRQSDVKSV